MKQNPDRATFHYHLGMAYERDNNHAIAKKELEQALQISPNYSEADKIRKILRSREQLGVYYSTHPKTFKFRGNR